MQQFHPIRSFQHPVDMTYVGTPFEDAESEDIPQPNATSPYILISGQIPVITTEQLEAIAGEAPETGALSLIDALRSTMSPHTTGRLVVIPGSKKRKKATQEKEASSLRMSPRLRHAIIISVILLMAIITLISLSPLASGLIGEQGSIPVFSGIGNWVQGVQLSWQFQAHNNVVKQSQPGQGNPTLPPITLPKSQYIAVAQQDALAVGISPDYFVRQINVESGFNPNAVSSAGAVGIAQFLPSTAAGLGINPWDPIQALRGAAQLMANYAHQYGGNYAKALAAYNGGTGTVQNAVNNCGANWLNCLPWETRHYIYEIMGI